MPSSSPAFIPEVITILGQIQPNSILDIGIGWGKYGLLCREYLYGKVDNLKIDGIEPFVPYIKEHQKAIYDEIYISPIEELIDDLNKYDLILFMDVIEHLDKEKGEEILTKLLRKCRWCFVSTPNGFYEQGAEFGNELERHLSGWTKEDLDKFKEVYLVWDNPVQIMYLYKGELV